MVHVFKRNRRVTRVVLCYSRQGRLLSGRADHKYDPEACAGPTGALLCCIRCHRHIWSIPNASSICPHCATKLTATAKSHPSAERWLRQPLTPGHAVIQHSAREGAIAR